MGIQKHIKITKITFTSKVAFLIWFVFFRVKYIPMGQEKALIDYLLSVIIISYEDYTLVFHFCPDY